MPTQEGIEQPDTVDSSRNQNSSKSGGNNKNSKNQQGKQKKTRGGRPKIKGELDALGYNVYLIGSPHQADMYTTTTKAIADYVGKECGAAMRTLVMSGREQRLLKPRQPTPRDGEDKVSTLDIEEWKTKLNHYYKKLDKYTKDKAKVFKLLWSNAL